MTLDSSSAPPAATAEADPPKQLVWPTVVALVAIPLWIVLFKFTVRQSSEGASGAEPLIAWITAFELSCLFSGPMLFLASSVRLAFSGRGLTQEQREEAASDVADAAFVRWIVPAGPGILALEIFMLCTLYGVDPGGSDIGWIATWGMAWTALGFFIFGILVAVLEEPRMWLPFHLRNRPRWAPEDSEAQEPLPLDEPQ